MQIKHLSHSGFLVEDRGDCLLFDVISPFDVSKDNERLVAFASHSHPDHFKREIYKNLYSEEKAHFIFSKDIKRRVSREPIVNLHILANYEKVAIGDIHIESFGSTDKGNSYLVSLHGKNFFHSGDLNWWHWKKMNEQELDTEERDYKREVDRLKGKSIDYAFIPVDPRLEEYAYLAINYFIETVKPKAVIPMHSFGQYDFYKDLEKHINLNGTALLNISSENQLIIES